MAWSLNSRLPGSDFQFTIRRANPRGVTKITRRERHADRKPADLLFSCAILSDDGGATWQVSEFFPEGFTEEAALVELQDDAL